MKRKEKKEGKDGRNREMEMKTIRKKMEKEKEDVNDDKKGKRTGGERRKGG